MQLEHNSPVVEHSPSTLVRFLKECVGVSPDSAWDFIIERISSFDAIGQVRFKNNYIVYCYDVTSSKRYGFPPNLCHVCINRQLIKFQNLKEIN